mmetsp:Transcript_40775/g.88189  ORF Transcript_40775/g.88189 Transcript_40775/m.88189 type:complete len:85 (-) Transcript_40775:683-937(-)
MSVTFRSASSSPLSLPVVLPFQLVPMRIEVHRSERSLELRYRAHLLGGNKRCVFFYFDDNTRRTRLKTWNSSMSIEALKALAKS